MVLLLSHSLHDQPIGRGAPSVEDVPSRCSRCVPAGVLLLRRKLRHTLMWVGVWLKEWIVTKPAVTRKFMGNRTMHFTIKIFLLPIDS